MSGSVTRPPRLGIVADDITGSGDIGSMLAPRGWAVRVFTAAAFDNPSRVAGRLANSRTDGAVIDTDSRFDHPDLAREKVRRACEILLAWGAALGAVLRRRLCLGRRELAFLGALTALAAWMGLSYVWSDSGCPSVPSPR